jgi:hypothetical protein
MRLRWTAVIFLFSGFLYRSDAAFQFSLANDGVSTTLNAVVYDGISKFVIVGTNSTVVTVSLGANGLRWDSNSVPTARQDLKTVTFGNSNFVASGTSNNVFSSLDGLNWTVKSQAFPGSSFTVMGLAFNATHFVAAPAIVSLNWADAALSTWHAATIANPYPLESYRAVTALDTNGFVLCGIRGVIRISEDGGQNWMSNRGINIAEPDLNGIVAAGKTLVCVGTGGRITVSANRGTNWLTTTSGTTANLNAVACTASGYIAVGDGGVILTSPDGTNWTANASPATTNLRGVAFASSGQLQGLAILVGDGGTVAIGTPTPAPTLTITNSSNGVIVSWPASANGWTLQTNNNLALAAWGSYAGPIINNTVTNSLPGSNLFYRLIIK